jgi:hypothetical protein
MPIILGNAKETWSIGGRTFGWGDVQRFGTAIFDWTGNLRAPLLYPAFDPVTGTPWGAITGTGWGRVTGTPWSPLT